MKFSTRKNHDIDKNTTILGSHTRTFAGYNVSRKDDSSLKKKEGLSWLGWDPDAFEREVKLGAAEEMAR